MRSIRKIEEIPAELENCPADALEGQDLDFKQWDISSLDKAIRTVVDWVICMANGGGGTVVFGVPDDCIGREKRSWAGLSNEDIRKITHFDRNQARRLIRVLMQENQEIQQEGQRRWVRYAYRP